jgi:hypothetical protein
MSIYRVEVTQEHIDRGEKMNCHDCPIALAVSAALGQEVTVGAEIVHLGKGLAYLPRSVSDWIVEFDLGGRVAPFVFDLEVPQQ